MWQFLYHVTPVTNGPSIQKGGIDPKFSQGKRKVSWWVDGSNVLWALAHVSAKREIPVSHLVVCRFLWNTADMTRTRWPGVYTTPDILAVDDILPSSRWTDEPRL